MLRANFDNSDEALFPSQFVNVIMLLDTLKDVVTVPVRAVQRGAPGNYVYLVADDDTVAVHPVTLGAQDGDFLAVTAGLSPGDRVVTDGADRLRDGAKVSIPDTKSTQPAAGEGRRPGGANGHNNSGTHEHGNWQHRKRPQQDDSSQPKPDGSASASPPPSGP